MSSGFTIKNTMAGKAMSGQGTNNEISLNLICLREDNKYIFSNSEFDSLKKSISEQGLYSPITVNEIRSYLNEIVKAYGNDMSKWNKEMKDSFKFYKQKLEEGRQYFVTTGHRRFKAYCSLAIGEDVKTSADVDEFYKKFEPVFSKNQDYIKAGEFEKINKYCSIKCFIVNDDLNNERFRYNSANLDQRRTLDFEIVINCIDEMKWTKAKDEQGNETDESVWDRIIRINKTNRIQKMTERAAIDAIKKISPNCKPKSGIEAKQMLETVKANELPGYNSDVNEEVSKYIFDKKGKKISVSRINIIRKVLNTLPSEVINLIYEGHISFENAVELSNFYDKLSTDKSLSAIVNLLKQEDFKLNDLKAQYVKTKKSQRKVSMSEKDWVELFRQVYEKEISIEDAYKKLKSFHLVK